MAKYQDLTGYVDSYLGKLTPEQMAVINDFLNHPSGFEPVQREQMAAAARIIRNQLGIQTDAGAGNFLNLVRNVRKNGGADIDPGTFKEQIGGREEYQTDDEFINAYLKANGLEGDPNRATQNQTQQPQQMGPGDELAGQIQAFINSMMGPVGPGDATYDTIMRSATNAAQAYGGKAGLNARSSLGNTAAGSLATAGVAAYEQQRRELGLQGMNALSNRDIQLGQLQQQWVAMQNGIAEQKASAEQAQRTATGQVVGGVIGAIPGIIAAPYTGGASLGLIGAGSAIGGGWAGSTTSAPKYQTNYSGPKGRNPYTGF